MWRQEMAQANIIDNMADIELSLVVPVFNEEDTIPVFVKRIKPVLDAITQEWEVIFVNDGSRDTTLKLLRELNAGERRFKTLNLSRNFGKEPALTAGIDAASGRAVIPMDVDLQDPPELISEMVAKWREGFDMVLAVRSDRASDNFMKRWTAQMFYKIINDLSAVDIPADVGDFRLMDRRVITALGQYRERGRFMKGLFASLGFNQTVVYFARPIRAAGTTKLNVFKLWALALEGIISFSAKPLKVWTYVGLTSALIALVYMLVIIARIVFFGISVPGYASMMSVMLFMNGMILTGLGVIGEYIARIFNEVKARPIYIVSENIGFTEQVSQPALENQVHAISEA